MHYFKKNVMWYCRPGPKKSINYSTYKQRVMYYRVDLLLKRNPPNNTTNRFIFFKQGQLSKKYLWLYLTSKNRRHNKQVKKQKVAKLIILWHVRFQKYPQGFASELIDNTELSFTKFQLILGSVRKSVCNSYRQFINVKLSY